MSKTSKESIVELSTSLKSSVIGIHLKEYKSFYGSPSSHPLTSDFGLSVTDKTSYRPDISSARAFAGSVGVGTSSRVGVYDFPDGKDTGETLMTFLRSKSLDVTEIDQVMNDLLQSKENMIRADVEKFISENKDKEKDSILENIKSFFSKSDSSSNVAQNTTSE